jgi:HSP20 family molecular chaperone IbpA
MGRTIIPPRTMRDVSRQVRHRSASAVRLSARVHLAASSIRRARSETGAAAKTSFSAGLFHKPRNWRFQTKPLFKRLNGPLIDVFDEAEEVLIVIDLSGFQPDDVALQLTPERYFIHARRGGEVFHEEILLPPEADVEKCVQRFRNGILELTMPRRSVAAHPKGEP